MAVDSSSMGDPARYRTLGELEQGLKAIPPAPADDGRVTLIVSRGEGGTRNTPGCVTVTPETGMPGDAWGRSPGRNPEMQLAVIQRDVATLIANGQPLTLFGDNLILDLDLSAGSLPPGSRLRAGTALLEVTPMPHNGCRKFNARFGNDALRFASGNELRHRNLRGIYMRAVESGEIGVGDAVKVVSRPA